MLFITFGATAVLNVLFLFGIVSLGLSQIGLWILILTVFLVSLLGLILKKINKNEVYPINFISPVKELGVLYIGVMIVWAVTYFLAVLSR